MRNLSEFTISLEVHTNLQTLEVLTALVCHLETLTTLVLFSNGLNQIEWNALLPVLSKLERFSYRARIPALRDDHGFSPETFYDAFANNSSLKVLELPTKVFPPGTIPGLLRAVPAMTCLESLCLSKFVIDNTNADAVMEMIKLSKKLSSFSHDSFSLEEDVCNKIIYYLSLNEIEHERFVRDAPLSLWPNALARINQK